MARHRIQRTARMPIHNTTQDMLKINNNQLLSRTECSALRAMAIAGIVLHNYCHWLGFAVKENEYTFDKDRSMALMRALLEPDINLPVHLLSFFGHYGVPVFLFLSAYGLVAKYEHTPHVPVPDRMSFMRTHFRKLFDMMIVGFAIFIMVDAITPGAHRYAVPDIIGQLLMLNNLMPSPDKVIWPGPYWFFGLMLQVYAVYILLLRRGGWLSAVAVVVVCWGLQVVCDPQGETLNRLRYNFIGSMLPFCAGLLYARYCVQMPRRIWALITFLSYLSVILCGMNFHLWLWAPLYVCLAAVGTVKLMPVYLCIKLSHLGKLSAALFVIHPVARKIFIGISRRGDVYAGLLLYIIACVALAWATRLIINKMKKG